MKILLVEDERMLSEVIATGLRKIGYAVDTVYDGSEALDFFELNEYDLIILDINIPVLDGFEVLSIIRKKDIEVKILILSAKTEIESKLKGFDWGVNDYLTKPFDFLELQARINALIRRDFNFSPTILTSKTLQLNTAKKEVTLYQEKIELTKKEYGILEYLLLHKDEVISSEELIEHIWDSDVDLFSNSLKFHMSSLRKKIRGTLDEDDLIKTIRGQGYLISGEPNEK